MIPQQSTSLKNNPDLYLQKCDSDYFKHLHSWRKSRNCPDSKQLYLPNEATIRPLVSTQLHATSEASGELLHLPQPDSGSMSRECRAFKYNMPLLRDTIGSQLSTLKLAGDMWSKGLITHEVLEEIAHSSGPVLKDKQLLLDALHSKILTNAAHFYEFLGILQQEPALEDCCRQLESFPGRNN